jgi:hypothetical protein
MFTAKCSYIKKLLPPEEFERRMEDAIGLTLLARLRTNVKSTLFDDRPDRFGLDRYSVDHWVGSHPSIRPCDLSSDHDWEHWLTADRNDADFRWSMAPRPPLSSPFDMNFAVTNQTLARENDRIREVFFLAGHLIQWYTLYHEAPGTESWVWSWFPDGDRWRHGVEVHGSDVVYAVTEQYVDDKQ